MKKFPSIPRIANAPAQLFESGHLWILEKVDGANMRFQLQESGLIHFGDRNKVYDDPESVPAPYQHAVRHIREHLDREAIRRAVEDTESVVFFGEAMHHHSIEYDWARTPSFLGFDVYAEGDSGFLTPDRVEGIFEAVGLHAVNAVEKERRARDFDPDSYTVPQSAWYDGPAEGLIIRNKRRERAKLLHPAFQEVDETVPVERSPTELAARYATDRRFEKIVAKLRDQERPVTFEALYERVREDIVREEHKQLYHGNTSLDRSAFRSAVAGLCPAA